jgi:hypothetical protein
MFELPALAKLSANFPTSLESHILDKPLPDWCGKCRTKTVSIVSFNWGLCDSVPLPPLALISSSIQCFCIFCCKRVMLCFMLLSHPTHPFYSFEDLIGVYPISVLVFFCRELSYYHRNNIQTNAAHSLSVLSSYHIVLYYHAVCSHYLTTLFDCQPNLLLSYSVYDI